MTNVLVIKDPAVIDIVRAALRDRVASLEMTAETQELVGEQQECDTTLRAWARARAALRIVTESEEP